MNMVVTRTWLASLSSYEELYEPWRRGYAQDERDEEILKSRVSKTRFFGSEIVSESAYAWKSQLYQRSASDLARSAEQGWDELEGPLCASGQWE